MQSNDPLDKGDLDLGSSSRFSKADTEKASEFFGMCGMMSVVGETLTIRGGGGESTSSSIEDDRDRVERSLDRDLLRDRDRTLRLLESYPLERGAPSVPCATWYTLLLSSSSDSFLTSRLMPNLISSASKDQPRKTLYLFIIHHHKHSINHRFVSQKLLMKINNCSSR